MRGKIISVLVSFALLLAFCIPAHAAAKYTMRFANCTAKDFSWGRAAEEFKKDLEEASNGQIEVQVFHSSSLGTNREVAELLRMGTADFMIAGSTHVTSYVPQLGVIVFPYLWKDRQTMFQALDGDIGKTFSGLLAKKGLVLLDWWDNGFRDVTTKSKPIMSVADMKGLRIRTLPVNVLVAFFKALGAAPTPVGWSELYTALQQGVVDAEENPPAMIYFAKFQEVQKYLSLTKAINEPGVLLMSEKVMNKLPPELQQAVRVAAQKATMWQRPANAKDNQEFLEKLSQAGMKVNEVPPQNLAEFKKIALSVYPEATKDLGEGGQELLDRLVSFNK
ncbi:MAG: TRAP transporter substrate-binding protein [Desulfobaccales bacterium]